MALGKIIRLNDDGTLPADNPFQDKGELAKSYWSLGHRNALGLAFDQNGRLWSHEMGPKDGDELNLIEKGANYGWPVVSEGTHYSGTEIPSHDTRPEFNPPKVAWVPTIAPSGLVIYSGAARSNWEEMHLSVDCAVGRFYTSRLMEQRQKKLSVLLGANEFGM